MDKRIAYIHNGDYARFREAIHEELSLAAADLLDYLRPIIAEEMMGGKMFQGDASLMKRLKGLKFEPEPFKVSLPPAKQAVSPGKVKLHGDPADMFQGSRPTRRSKRD